jgi:hypothetical protein
MIQKKAASTEAAFYQKHDGRREGIVLRLIKSTTVFLDHDINDAVVIMGKYFPLQSRYRQTES